LIDVDAGLRARFAQKPDRQVRIGTEDELDSDGAVEAAVTRLVDLAHAALAESLADPVDVHRRS
jgi:uncharacterized membrane protein